MALSIVVRFRTGRFDAASLTPTEPEWPPSPARVFCALVASAAGDADSRAALSVLENAGAPELHASTGEELALDYRSGFVVTNTLKPGKGSQTWPGRTNGLRQRVGVLPGCDSVALVWPDLEVDDATFGRLSRLAWQVPYVGRTTSDAEVTVIPEAVSALPGQVVWHPVELGLSQGADAVLDVAYPGYYDALERSFQAGEPAWRAPRTAAPYRWRGDEPTVAAQLGPFAEFVVLEFERRRVPTPGHEALEVAAVFRDAVLSHMRRDVPQVSGHGADGRTHVAFLPLPHVGFPHSDGHIMGVAAAIPGDLVGADHAALIRALHDITALGGERWRTPVRIARHRPPLALSHRRWRGPEAGETRWTSATPLMLDKFPQSKITHYQRVCESLELAGYPAPIEVEILPGPPLTGGIHRPRQSQAHTRRPRRPFAHCRITFPKPVRGPVVAGALRYFGMGLFVPDPATEDPGD